MQEDVLCLLLPSFQTQCTWSRAFWLITILLKGSLVHFHDEGQASDWKTTPITTCSQRVIFLSLTERGNLAPTIAPGFVISFFLLNEQKAGQKDDMTPSLGCARSDTRPDRL